MGGRIRAWDRANFFVYTSKLSVIGMKNLDRITVDPAVMSGQPCIRNMRLTVRRVLNALSVMPEWKTLMAEYPGLEEEDIRQALSWAAREI